MLRPANYNFNYPVFHDLFEEFEKQFLGNFGPTLKEFKTDVIDKGDQYELKAELPGFTKEDIDIQLKENYLTITATHKEESEDKQDNYIRRERRFGAYTRSFNVANIEKGKIEASYENSILCLVLPKQKEVAEDVKRIELK